MGPKNLRIERLFASIMERDGGSFKADGGLKSTVSVLDRDAVEDKCGKYWLAGSGNPAKTLVTLVDRVNCSLLFLLNIGCGSLQMPGRFDRPPESVLRKR